MFQIVIADSAAFLLRRAKGVGVAIDLQTGDPETGDAVTVDRTLPGEELLDRQGLAQARLRIPMIADSDSD
jgi:hypothetical protein